MNPTDLTALELRDAIARRDMTATRAVRCYLERIHALNPLLNAYTQVFEESALRRAAQVDAGELRGPLAGVPIAVKDNLCTEEGLTTCASRMLANYRSPFTATAVSRLEAAGAIVLGKTNLDEFAMGSSTENSRAGPTRNPWDPGRVPGGSSGGSAAAVAGRLAAAALGSDTGGSIRQPAAFCGITGLKPTYGRVSRWGLVAFASSLDQVGPMTRDARDAAALLEVIAGADPRDATCAPQPAPRVLDALDQALLPLRIGVPRAFLSPANAPGINEAVLQAIDILARAGASVVDVDLPHADYGIPTYYLVATAEASSNLARYDGVHFGHRSAAATPAGANAVAHLYSQSRAEGFGPEVKRRIMLGTYALSSGYYDAYYLRALKVRRLIQRDFNRAFANCDLLLTPTTPSAAFQLGEKAGDPMALYLADVYTVNANLTGLPALHLPTGLTSLNGVSLPVGVQLLAPAMGESLLLRTAHRIQAELPPPNLPA
jgi:aspartyl-tRNA(Asn)/glutamyl-tRNA(Gln) amidotransferase subunit A